MPRGTGIVAWVNGLQVSVGMLLFSVGAVTSLAEERARGSLDVLMTTPLTTAQVLWGKWWGSFRDVPSLCFFPVLAVLPEASSRGCLEVPLLLSAMILAYGAAFTSLGLACAGWTARVSRAAFWSAGICVFLSVGVLMILAATPGSREAQLWTMASPFFGPGNLTFATQRYYRFANRIETAAVLWLVAYLVLSAALMLALHLTFNRSLGRARQGRSVQRAA
jgi:hypothetical protein